MTAQRHLNEDDIVAEFVRQLRDDEQPKRCVPLDFNLRDMHAVANEAAVAQIVGDRDMSGDDQEIVDDLVAGGASALIAAGFCTACVLVGTASKGTLGSWVQAFRDALAVSEEHGDGTLASLCAHSGFDFERLRSGFAAALDRRELRWMAPECVSDAVLPAWRSDVARLAVLGAVLSSWSLSTSSAG